MISRDHYYFFPYVLILITGLNVSTNGAEAAGEARSVPSYVQSRPVYSKPAPKLPKLLFKPPGPVQPKENEIGGQGGTGNGQNPNLVTQTVYGFLDFVTTIGNTVMVFTPQTKQGKLILRVIKLFDF